MNRLRNLTMYSVLVLVTLVMLFAVYRTEKKLDAMIEEHHLRFTGSIENAPPLVTFTTMALGSFRGLIADFLWFRAAGLQEKGNYFEMVQLARWITDLQPTFSGATAYLAWNMAYNISVTCSDFGDRWRWVNEGIKLIRDRALEYNPEDPALYKEIAWIYQHKMGNIMDDANLYYKNRLAVQMTEYLGPRQNIAALAAAPKNEAAFRQAYGTGHPVWTALGKAGFENLDELYFAYRQAKNEIPESIRTRFRDQAFIGKLDDYLRAQSLRRDLKLDPVVMNGLDEKYGRFDWRIAESQGIYWASLGLAKTPGGRDLNLERLITQNLYESFRAGRLLMIDDENYARILTVPNLDIVDTVKREYEKAWEENDKQNSFFSAKINFMKEAVTVLFNYGKFAKAQEYYNELRKIGEHEILITRSLEEFVLNRWVENIRDATPKKMNDAISGLLYTSFYYLAWGDDDAAAAHERLARYIYHNYMSTTAEGQDFRVGLVAYDKIKQEVYEGCLRTFPPAMAIILRSKMSASDAPAAPAAGPLLPSLGRPTANPTPRRP